MTNTHPQTTAGHAMTLAFQLMPLPWRYDPKTRNVVAATGPIVCRAGDDVFAHSEVGEAIAKLANDNLALLSALEECYQYLHSVPESQVSESSEVYLAVEEALMLARGHAAAAPVADQRDAEVKRLREALAGMVKRFTPFDPGSPNGIASCEELQEARAALAESGVEA